MPKNLPFFVHNWYYCEESERFQLIMRISYMKLGKLQENENILVEF